MGPQGATKAPASCWEGARARSPKGARNGQSETWRIRSSYGGGGGSGGGRSEGEEGENPEGMDGEDSECMEGAEGEEGPDEVPIKVKVKVKVGPLDPIKRPLLDIDLDGAPP
jgi:hypothetical protein